MKPTKPTGPAKPPNSPAKLPNSPAKLPKTINADADGLRQACEALKSGGLVAYPTESFYGIGARHDDERALKRLFALKGSREGKPFSLIVPDRESLKHICTGISATAQRLMERYWPGPLTLVLEARAGLSELIAPWGTVAVREPGESAALELVRKCGFPITATSANPSNDPPAITARDVARYFPEGLEIILNTADTADATVISDTTGGLASTIVDATADEIRVLRHGAIELDKGGLA